jgi:hypothetical protein
MRTRHLLGIVLVIWIPLGYHLLADDELIAEIPLLELKYAKSTPTTDNYDINLMALSQSKPDPQSTLEKVLNYQPLADNPFQTLRLPELESLENLQHPLLCELNKTPCRKDIAAQQAALTTLLTSHSNLLQQYEALQYLTDIASAEGNDVRVDVGSVVNLEHLYALHIYQLMLQGDFSQAEYKLVTLIKQQRRFLSSAAADLRRILTINNFSQFYLPLSIELSQRSTSSLSALAGVMQPFSLNEMSGIASKQYEFVQLLELIRTPELEALKAESTSLTAKLLYKPNLTVNTLYYLHHLSALAQLGSKLDWYNFFNSPKNTNKFIKVNSLDYILSYYRNYIGGVLISTLAPIKDNFGEQMVAIDLKLYLLQPLLQSAATQAQLSFNSFALNPYNNTSVINKNGQWCYALDEDICLAAE